MFRIKNMQQSNLTILRTEKPKHETTYLIHHTNSLSLTKTMRFLKQRK